MALNSVVPIVNYDSGSRYKVWHGAGIQKNQYCHGNNNLFWIKRTNIKNVTDHRDAATMKTGGAPNTLIHLYLTRNTYSTHETHIEYSHRIHMKDRIVGTCMRYSIEQAAAFYQLQYWILDVCWVLKWEEKTWKDVKSVVWLCSWLWTINVAFKR